MAVVHETGRIGQLSQMIMLIACGASGLIAFNEVLGTACKVVSNEISIILIEYIRL